MKFLKLEKRNKISYVSFTRTESLNALNGQTLKELGFNDVKNLGGFDDWVKAGGKIDT